MATRFFRLFYRLPNEMLPFLGAFAGLAGILLLAGPFVRETLGMSHAAAEGVEDEATAAVHASISPDDHPVFRLSRRSPTIIRCYGH